MKCLITGSSGFIGRNLAEQLPYDIITLDKVGSPDHKMNMASDFFYKLPKVDCIIHCAADPAVLSGVDDPLTMYANNVTATMNCLEYARKNNAAFIYLSSSRVYEHDGVRSFYGATKLCSEHLITEYGDMYGIKYVINRLGLVSGKYQNGHINQGVVCYWIKQHLNNGKLDYIGYGGKGDQIRDVLHVDDLCELIKYEVNNIDKVNNKTFDAGGGIFNSFTLADLTLRIQQITGKYIKIGSIPETRTSDIFSYITDNGHVTKLTGWKPKKSLYNIIYDITKWLQEG